MRLLFLTQDFPPAIGGIQTYAASLAEVFAEHCESLMVMAPKQEGAAELDAQLPYRVERIATSSDWMRARALPAVLNHARTFKPHGILTGHWYVAGAALVARKMGLTERVFTAAHAMELRKNLLPQPLEPLYRWHRQSILKGVDGCFPVSRFTGGWLQEEGVSSEKITVVPNGTDIARFDTEEAAAGASEIRKRLGLEGKKLLLSVCRLVERKGLDTVIEAMPRILQAIPEAHYCVVGKGPYREILETQVRRLGLEESVTFAGSIPYSDLPSVYHSCDVFAMPARQVGASVEGFGLVYCEANAAGKPAIGGNAGGAPDAIIHGETGLLIEPNDVGAFAREAIALLGNPARAQAMGEAGKARIYREGTWKHAGEKMLSVMESSCGLS